MKHNHNIFDFIALSMNAMGVEKYAIKSESEFLENPNPTPKTFAVDCKGAYYFLWHINKADLNFIIKANQEYLEAQQIIIKQAPIIIEGTLVYEPYVLQYFMFSGTIDITLWQGNPTFLFYKVIPLKDE